MTLHGLVPPPVATAPAPFQDAVAVASLPAILFLGPSGPVGTAEVARLKSA